MISENPIEPVIFAPRIDNRRGYTFWIQAYEDTDGEEDCLLCTVCIVCDEGKGQIIPTSYVRLLAHWARWFGGEKPGDTHYDSDPLFGFLNDEAIRFLTTGVCDGCQTSDDLRGGESAT